MGWALALRRREEALSLAAAGVVLLVLALLPLVALGTELVRGESIRHAIRSLSSPQTCRLFGSSVAVATVTTGLCLAIGLPLGVIFGRSDLPHSRPLLLAHAFPVFLPPFLLALGWFHLLGRNGLVGSDATAMALFSGAGAVGVLALALTPIVTLLVAASLQSLDPSLEEAALVVAGPFRTAVRILLPLVRPAAVLSAVIVFSLSFSELGVPMFLRVGVYPALVFSRLGGVEYAPGEAFALALPLLVVALVLLAVERGAVGRRSLTILGVRSREVPALRLGRWRSAAAASAWGAALLPLLPVGALAIRGFGRGGFDSAWEWAGASVWNSTSTAFLAATVILVLAVFVGQAAARGRRGGTALDVVAVLAFVTPAPVLGVGLIAAWNRPSLQVVYGTSAIVVLAFAARYAAVGVRAAAVSFAQGSIHVEEAAAVTGARFLRRLRVILLPLHARGLVTAWVLAAVFCLRDLETAVLVYPAGREPLTVRIFTLEANGAPATVAALACVLVALTATVVGAGSALLLRRSA